MNVNGANDWPAGMVTVAGTLNCAVFELARLTVKGCVVGPLRLIVPRIDGFEAFSAIELTVEVSVKASGTVVAVASIAALLDVFSSKNEALALASMTNWSDPHGGRADDGDRHLGLLGGRRAGGDRRRDRSVPTGTASAIVPS